MKWMVASFVSLWFLGACSTAYAARPSLAEMIEQARWFAAKFLAVDKQPDAAGGGLVVVANHDPVQYNAWCCNPLSIGGKTYFRGLYCHAYSKVIVRLPAPAQAFDATVGVVSNAQTSGGRGSVFFAVGVGEQERFRSPLMREGTAGLAVHVDINGAQEIALIVEDAGDGIACDQAGWAEARVTLEDRRVLWIGDLPILDDTQKLPYATEVPFSFRFGGRPSTELLPNWKIDRGSIQRDNSRFRHVLTYTDSQSGLQVRCEAVQYMDFPTIEWTVYLKNTGTQDTPVIEDIQALDALWKRYPTPHPPLGEFTLHYNRGDNCSQDSYQPLRECLEPSRKLRFAPPNGRPTSRAFPYYNIEWLSEGVIVALGWPGQWAAEFVRDDADGLRIRAGQELTHLTLRPGEEVRTPLVVVQFWKGDWIRAQNIWRAWMREHNMPRPGGKPYPPQLNACSSHQFHEMENANEDNQKLFVDRYLEKDLRLDYWWMDAGWYVGGKEQGWPHTGTWEVDVNRFPRGLRAVCDHAHAKQLKSVVWFEPERVAPGTWLYEKHPEWLLGKDGEQKLLDLGNAEAREWLTNHVHKLLTEEAIDLYRQDFNIDPLVFWRAGDPPDRQGVTENHDATGYLAFWDELKRRNPELRIDSCASGGRRNDLETLRRAVPLLRSDYIFEPIGQQGHTYGLAFWMPFFGTGLIATDPYSVRSVLTPGITLCWDVRRDDLPYDQMRELIAQWRHAVPCVLFGDYYPLTSYSLDDSAWIGWQFDWADHGTGIVQMFRRPNSPYEVVRCPLRGLEGDKQYRLRLLGAEKSEEMTGDDLTQKGVRIAIEERPGAITLLYEVSSG